MLAGKELFGAGTADDDWLRREGAHSDGPVFDPRYVEHPAITPNRGPRPLRHANHMRRQSRRTEECVEASRTNSTACMHIGMSVTVVAETIHTYNVWFYHTCSGDQTEIF